MKLVQLFSSLYLSECEAWIDKNPGSGYLFIDRDTFSGLFIIYGE
jgi:hypothetical protein